MYKVILILQKRDTEGISFGRSNTNPIFDIFQYEVKFSDVGLRKLTSKIIAEVICAQCEEYGSVYCLLDFTVDKKRMRICCH